VLRLRRELRQGFNVLVVNEDISLLKE